MCCLVERFHLFFSVGKKCNGSFITAASNAEQGAASLLGYKLPGTLTIRGLAATDGYRRKGSPSKPPPPLSQPSSSSSPLSFSEVATMFKLQQSGSKD